MQQLKGAGSPASKRILLAPTGLSAAGLYRPCISRHNEEPSTSLRREVECKFSSLGKSASNARANQSSVYGDLLVSKLFEHQSDRDFELQGLFGPSPTDWRRRTTRMKQAKTWTELRTFLPTKASDWTNVDTICLTAALSSLSRTSSPSRSNSSLSSSTSLEISKSFWVLMAIARPRFSEFDNQGLVSIAVAIAKMKDIISSSSDDLPLILNALLEASKPSMTSFSPQSLANLIWALATFEHQPCGSWLTSFYRQVDDQLDNLKSQDVANILWSLCKLDLMPDIWVRDGLVERALGAIQEQVQVQSSTSTSTHGLKGQDPATLIQCLARWYYLYNYRVSDEWLTEYLSLIQPSLGHYLPFDLVSIVHSCVVMNFQPSRSWMSQYYAQIMHSLKYDPTLSYSDFQRLMWALSRIEFAPPLTWQREFMIVSIPKLKHLKIRALTELVWALACWDTRPSPEWTAAFFTASHAKLEDARPQHMACMLNAAVKLEVSAPEPWLNEALESFCRNIDEAKAHDVVSVLENITIVCHHKSWLSHRSTQHKIRQLAEVAGAKFGLLDAFMHGKLLTALAIAEVTPAADWLKRQQQYLVGALGGGGGISSSEESDEEWEGSMGIVLSSANGRRGDSVGEGEENSQRVKERLKGVYQAWQVDLDPMLQRALM